MAKHRVGNFGLSEELVRYGFVAISAFFVDLGLFYFLAQSGGINFTVAAVLAYIAGTIWNYFFSIRWAFAYRRLAGQMQEPLIFWLIALAGLVATVGLLNIFRVLGLGIVVSKIAAEATIAIASFGSKKILLFTNWQDIAEVLSWYRAAPLSVRLHVLIRRWTLPLDRLLRYVPKNAETILEIGTGYGLVLLVLARRRYHQQAQITMAGTDIDEQKLEYARLAARAHKAQIQFTALPQDGQKWDVVIIVDVLYLLSPAEQEKLINQALGFLKADGSLLIKEMAFRPAWKFWLLRAQEFVSVNVLRITARQDKGKFHFTDLPAIAQHLEQKKCKTELHRLDRGWLHPHLLLVVNKP